jgi:indolepyruvate ferredoxin oxidoreductase
MSDGRFTATAGRVYLSGVQALVRLTVVQRMRDAAAGLSTAGFVSGYRGSPLGGLDVEFVRARDVLSAHEIRFQPGVNEELAATAVWGHSRSIWSASRSSTVCSRCGTERGRASIAPSTC